MIVNENAIFFIFLSGFLFIGESYTFFLENFQDKYVQVGYYLETGDSEEEMRNTVLEKADEFNAKVFTISKKDGGAFSREITIYMGILFPFPIREIPFREYDNSAILLFI